MLSYVQNIKSEIINEHLLVMENEWFCSIVQRELEAFLPAQEQAVHLELTLEL